MSTRVLHLIDAPNSGWSAFDALSALVAAPTPALRHTIALLGGASADRLALQSGLKCDLRIAPPLGRATLAAPRLRSMLRGLEDHDVVHAWSPESLALAGMVCPRLPRCATLSTLPSQCPWSIQRLATLRAARAASRLMATSRFVLDAWEATVRGRRRQVETSLLPLPITIPPCDPAARKALRARWGVSDDVVVILAVGEPEERIDARWFTFRAGVLAVAGIPAAVVVPSRSDGLERALRYTERHHHAWPIFVDDAPLPTLMHGCDIAIWHAGPYGARTEVFGAHGLALCAAAGLPCVAEDHPLSREVAASVSQVRIVPCADSVATSRALFETVDALRAAGPRTAAATSTTDAWRARMTAQLLSAAGSDAPLPLATASLA